MKLQLATVAALAALVTAAPTPEVSIEERQDTQYRLPSTVILLATLANGTVIGSIKGDGNFTTKRIDYPFRVFYTSGNNGNDGVSAMVPRSDDCVRLGYYLCKQRTRS